MNQLHVARLKKVLLTFLGPLLGFVSCSMAGMWHYERPFWPAVNLDGIKVLSFFFFFNFVQHWVYRDSPSNINVYSLTLICPTFLLTGFLCIWHLLAAWYSIAPPSPAGGHQGRSPVTNPLSNTRSKGVKGRECWCWGCGSIKAGQEQVVGLSYGFPWCTGSLWVDDLTAEAAGAQGHRMGQSDYQVTWQRKGPKSEIATGGHVTYCDIFVCRTMLVKVTLAHFVLSLLTSGRWSVCWPSRWG